MNERVLLAPRRHSVVQDESSCAGVRRKTLAADGVDDEFCTHVAILLKE